MEILGLDLSGRPASEKILSGDSLESDSSKKIASAKTALKEEGTQGGSELEKTKWIELSKEGETVKKQAVLMMGEGYAVYLPEDEWKQSGTDKWTAEVNKKVRLWIKSYKSSSVKKILKKLAADGYAAVDRESKSSKQPVVSEMIKQNGNTISKVRLIKYENKVWGVFYCYPSEAEEGFGRELAVIADTFKIVVEK